MATTKNWRWRSRIAIRSRAASTPADADAEKDYRRALLQQLFRLQAELVKLQDWVVASGQKVVILFEGRDAAGKGGAIKRITQKLNPRVAGWWRCRRPMTASARSGTSSATCRTFRGRRNRLFDRSWYNRAGVERVMGFCTPRSTRSSSAPCRSSSACWFAPASSLLKYWFSITDEEQYLRFLGRIHDPLKQWKLSPMDLESRRRWEDYTKAKEVMLERSHIPEARWWVVQAVDKKRARLNFHRSSAEAVSLRRSAETAQSCLPQREHHEHYSRQAVPAEMLVPEVY
jgi:polyphosphate kinase